MKQINLNTSVSGVLSLVLLLCMAGVGLHAEASDKKSGRERDALRRMQQQLVQVQEQATALEQDKAKLADDLGKSKAALKTAESRVAGLRREVGIGKQQQAALTQELALARTEAGATAQQLADTRKTLADTTRVLQQTTLDKNSLQAVKARNERENGACEARNLALYGLGRSLMERFENKSCGEILAEKEPFTGVRKVETENLLEEYRDKLDAQKRIKPPGE